MTELEKVDYARSFMEKLANGINPLDGQPIPEGDIANNVRLSRCFFYVSDILKQVYENGGVGKVEKTIPFSITREQMALVEVSPYAISGSEIARKLAAAVANPQMKSFSVPKLNRWLVQGGLMREDTDRQGKARRLPTDRGREMGIRTEQKMGKEGEYTAVLFEPRAQRFILDNLTSIVAAQ